MDDDDDESASIVAGHRTIIRLARQLIDYSNGVEGGQQQELVSNLMVSMATTSDYPTADLIINGTSGGDNITSLEAITTTTATSISLPNNNGSSTWSLLLTVLFYNNDKLDINWPNFLQAIILILLMLTTAIGNLFVIVAILIERNLRTIGNYLVLSLAIADLLVACLVMPLAGIYQILEQWTLGVLLCDIWTSTDVFCCTASILHLLAIALDRYWAVTRVDYIRCQRNERRILFMIALVWMAACVISLAPVFGWKDADFEDRITIERNCLLSQDIGYQIFATFTTFYGPLILTLIFYWKIYQVARKRIRRKPGNRVKVALQHPSTSSSNSSPSSRQSHLQQATNSSNQLRSSIKQVECQSVVKCSAGGVTLSGYQCKSNLIGSVTNREAGTKQALATLSDFEPKSSCQCSCHNCSNGLAMSRVAVAAAASATIGKGKINETHLARTATKENEQCDSVIKANDQIYATQTTNLNCAQVGQSNNNKTNQQQANNTNNNNSNHHHTTDYRGDNNNKLTDSTRDSSNNAIVVHRRDSNPCDDDEEEEEDAHEDHRRTRQDRNSSARLTSNNNNMGPMSGIVVADRQQGLKLNSLDGGQRETDYEPLLMTTASDTNETNDNNNDSHNETLVDMSSCVDGDGSHSALGMKLADAGNYHDATAAASGPLLSGDHSLSSQSQSQLSRPQTQPHSQPESQSQARNQQTGSNGSNISEVGDCSRCRRCHWAAANSRGHRLSTIDQLANDCLKNSGVSLSISSSDIRSESLASCSPTSSLINCAQLTTISSQTIGKQSGHSNLIKCGRKESKTCVDLLDDCCGCCCEQQSHFIPETKPDHLSQKLANNDDDFETAPHNEFTTRVSSIDGHNGGANLVANNLIHDRSTKATHFDANEEVTIISQIDYQDSEPNNKVSLGRCVRLHRYYVTLWWSRLKSLLLKEAQTSGSSINQSSCSMNDTKRHNQSEHKILLVQSVNGDGKTSVIRVCNLCNCARPLDDPNLSSDQQQRITEQLINLIEAPANTGTGGMVIAASTANIAVQTTVRQQSVRNSQPTTTVVVPQASIGSHQQSNSEGVESRRERKAAKTLAIITGVFVMCWLPFFVMAITMPLLNLKPHKYVFAVLLWLGYVNSMLNPIIYTIFSPDFRKAFKRLLCGSVESRARRERQRKSEQQQRHALNSSVQLEAGWQQQVSATMSVLSACFGQCVTCRWNMDELAQLRAKNSQSSTRTVVLDINRQGKISMNINNNNIAYNCNSNNNNRTIGTGELLNSTSNETNSRYTMDSTTTSVSPKTTIPSSSLAANTINKSPNHNQGQGQAGKQLQVSHQTSVTSGRMLIKNDF